ncbi:MAG TPA: hypothetical protein VMC81_02225 [Rhodocyclaceae bacterium]|nr:hypothetical protein [Rhodocyclaceae bacterium]
MLRIGLLLALSVLCAGPAFADVLITESEARLPAAVPPPATRAITRGPTIRVLSPDVAAKSLSSPFPLRIAFEPHGGAKIDPSLVKLTYLRSPNVELVDRVKAGLTEKGVELPSAEVPPGEHQLRVTVIDSDGRQSSLVFSLSVVK